MLLMIFVQSALVVISYFGTVALRGDLSSTPGTVGAGICSPPRPDCGKDRDDGCVFPQCLERYVSISDLRQIIKASTVGSLILARLAQPL